MTTRENPYRLGRAVVPSAYRIFLTPDLENATFAGRVEIDVDILESVSEIKMHAAELELGAATVSDGGTSYRSHEHRLDEVYETVTFRFDRQLPVGPAVIEIAFDGVLNDQLRGFYRSSYVDEAGATHTIATTQFENTDARRAFPCWDEPAFKATYQVNLTVPSQLAAYSNSPEVANVDLRNGLRTVSFAPTMKMSTYLVAFVVGDFEETAALDVDGVPLRVVYPAGKGHLTDLAMEAGAFSLRFFADYFNIEYPGEKLDMVAIPDFAAGAMENLGCVTFRENALLVDPATSSVAEQQRVAEVVAHEIAHMWFGDLVTMEWWEGIWLNEAFATFMAVLCVDAFRPQWKAWIGFGLERDAAMEIDGLHSTRPIEYEVISPSDTRGMFDLLTYEKGGSVLRMLQQYLGETVFRDGIRHYLSVHQYANTHTTDLWDALETISKQPVRELMDTWILQGGHPVVSLENNTVAQAPFAYGPARGESSIGSSWITPVLVRSLDGGPTSSYLLRDETIEVTGAPPLVVNAGGSGVYRSRYGRSELTALTARLGELEELERATLIADAGALVLAGQMTWPDFFELAKGLDGLDEPTPWGKVASVIDLVERALRDEQRPRLVAQVRELAAPQFERLGWQPAPDEDELTPQVRAIMVGLLGTVVEDPDVQAESVKRFEQNDLDGNLARSILRVVARLNRPGDYETFLERYREAPTPQEAYRYQWFAIPEFRDERVALDAAEKCFSEFRNQDGAIVLGRLSSNAVTGPAVWHYLTSRWDEALARFPENAHHHLAMGLPTFINDADFADQVEAFHTTHPIGGNQRTIVQDIERMRVGLAFASSIRAQF